ncbi:hypothetical protein Tco_1219104 [Tanacetum coccineum]
MIARERAAEQEAKDAALIEQIEDVQARMDADNAGRFDCRKEEVLCCTERSGMEGSKSGSITLFLMDSELVKDSRKKNDDSRKEAERSQKQAERDDIAINVESLATKYLLVD